MTSKRDDDAEESTRPQIEEVAKPQKPVYTPTERIYIFFTDDSVDAQTAEKIIAKYPQNNYITRIPVQDPGRSAHALRELQAVGIYPEVTSKGVIKSSFLVKDGGVAIYKLEEVSTVLMMYSKEIREKAARQAKISDEKVPINKEG